MPSADSSSSLTTTGSFDLLGGKRPRGRPRGSTKAQKLAALQAEAAAKGLPIPTCLPPEPPATPGSSSGGGARGGGSGGGGTKRAAAPGGGGSSKKRKTGQGQPTAAAAAATHPGVVKLPPALPYQYPQHQPQQVGFEVAYDGLLMGGMDSLDAEALQTILPNADPCGLPHGMHGVFGSSHTSQHMEKAAPWPQTPPSQPGGGGNLPAAPAPLAAAAAPALGPSHGQEADMLAAFDDHQLCFHNDAAFLPLPLPLPVAAPQSLPLPLPLPQAQQHQQHFFSFAGFPHDDASAPASGANKTEGAASVVGHKRARSQGNGSFHLHPTAADAALDVSGGTGIGMGGFAGPAFASSSSSSSCLGGDVGGLPGSASFGSMSFLLLSSRGPGGRTLEEEEAETMRLVDLPYVPAEKAQQTQTQTRVPPPSQQFAPPQEAEEEVEGRPVKRIRIVGAGL